MLWAGLAVWQWPRPLQQSRVFSTSACIKVGLEGGGKVSVCAAPGTDIEVYWQEIAYSLLAQNQCVGIEYVVDRRLLTCLNSGRRFRNIRSKFAVHFELRPSDFGACSLPFLHPPQHSFQNPRQPENASFASARGVQSSPASTRPDSAYAPHSAMMRSLSTRGVVILPPPAPGPTARRPPTLP